MIFKPVKLRQKESKLQGICLWLLIVCLTTSAYCGNQFQSGAKLEIQQENTAIKLDFTPMTEPISMYVLVRADNRIEVVRYARYRQSVVSIYQGSLSDAELTRLLTQYREPGIHEAWRRKNFAGTGLTRGNQFNLSFIFKGGATQECFGFVEDTPMAVQSLINDLVSLWKRLPASTLAAAYVRSEPITAERLEALRHAGKIRFTTVGDFPPDVRPLLTCAVSHPREFCALSHAQSERLRAITSPEQEIFLIDNGSGHQLMLLNAQ